MNFADAVVLEDNKSALTTNGMATHKSSLGSCVDLFFLIGASRGTDISKVFDAAYAENAELATRILLWARDVRGGAGERSTPRALLNHIEQNYPDLARVLISVWCKFGRWDDLLVFKNKEIKHLVYGIISNALNLAQNGLCAKWMPRKGPIANELRTYMGLSPKQYRKLLVNLTKVVETPMCAREWESINYAHVPSVAAGRYSKAFGRHDPNGYSKYREALKSGEAKINAGAVFPYQVLQTMISGDVEIGISQWDALPDYLGDDAILPMVDVSGSMETPVSGNITAMGVAVSLGVYIADKQKGAFKDLWLTFNHEPELVKLHGANIHEKLENVMENSDWGMNTNLEKAFERILEVAVNNNVAQEDMPRTLIILSDMEFDDCVHDSSNPCAYDMVSNQYQKAGYTLPKIVFWNIKGRTGNIPVTHRQDGTALVSGFNTTILKSICNVRESMTPELIMLNTVNVERYNLV